MTDDNYNPLQGETNEWPENDGIFDPEPEPIPDPEPFPEPIPDPIPDPEPASDPTPDSIPSPEPDPQPTPKPKPGSNPDPNPEDDIEKLLERTKHLERMEREKPASIAKKMCPTRHGCQGATDCDYCMGNYPV